VARSRPALFAALAFSLVAAAPVLAAPFDFYTFAGTITEAHGHGQYASPVAAGDTFRGALYYEFAPGIDPAALSLGVHHYSAQYGPVKISWLLALDSSAGPIVLSSGGRSSGSVAASPSGFGWDDDLPAAVGSPYNLDWVAVNLGFLPGAIDGEQIPTAIPVMEFVGGSVTIHWYDPEQLTISAYGEIDSIQTHSVPEAPSLVLLGIGLVGLVWAGWNRRRQTVSR
jgi:hypothetical protein